MGMTSAHCQQCGMKVILPEGQYFGIICQACSRKNTKSYAEQVRDVQKCLFDSYDAVKNPVMNLACSCPKCSPRC